MLVELSKTQREQRDRARSFVEQYISPHAAEWDRNEAISPEVIQQLKSRGYLGTIVGGVRGEPVDDIIYGLVTEEIARGCSSVRSLLTVHDMVALALVRWGSKKLKEEFEAGVRQARYLCALAVSEPETGSDAAGVQTEARCDGDTYVLSGRKKWITFGQIADLILVLARCDGRLTTFLVPATTPGILRTPLKGIFGTRASMLAEIEFCECRIPKLYLIGKVGFGFSHVIASALDLGRYSVAWGAVGIAQACLESCLSYTARRKQFGVCLNEHQLIRRKLSEMIAGTSAARLLCCRAGYLRLKKAPSSVSETLVAKYFASKTAVRSANDAVQVHGANGLTEEFPVARYLRDAKVTEIIEGTTQIQQLTIPTCPLTEL
jgi:glutaryl-CoA dehydrogenase (non-decarboxylating)